MENLINELQNKVHEYKTLFNDFPYKNDMEKVLEFEFEFYVTPLVIETIPKIIDSMELNKNLKVEIFVQYVLERYHDLFIKEVKGLSKDTNIWAKKITKDIVKKYTDTVMLMQFENALKKESYINDFYEKNVDSIVNVVKKYPDLALDCICYLRTPRLQLLFLKNKMINKGISYLITNDWIANDWDKWLAKYFIYPRNESAEDFLNKWVGPNKLHIKSCKKIFGTHYEEVKIWLKNNEKNGERKARKEKKEI